MTKLPAGSHSYYFPTTDTTTDEVATVPTTLNVVSSNQTIDVAVSQAGYNSSDYKGAKVVTAIPLTDTSYVVTSSAGTAASGNMTYEGVYWDKHVYTIDFTSVTASETDYQVVTNGVSSFPFPIAANVWNNYKDEMTAFYRILRASVPTSSALPPGYTDTAPSSQTRFIPTASC